MNPSDTSPSSTPSGVSASATTASTARWAGVALAATGALVLFAYRALIGFELATPAALPGAEEFLFEPTGSSPPLIFVVTAWLLYRRWPRIRRSIGAASSPGLAALALVPAAALCVWGHYVEATVLLLPSLSLMLIGAALLLAGTPGLRIVLFPAVFLLFAVPIPAILVNQIIYDMQLTTAAVTTWILQVAGLETVVSGDLIFRDETIFQVIESCSGLRTTETLLMASFLYVELFQRRNLHAVLIVASAPVIGLITNEIRVLSIVLNPYSGLSAVHTAQGLVMIVFGVLAIAALDRLLVTLLAGRDAPRRRTRRRTVPPVPAASLAAVALLGAVLSVATFAIAPWQPTPEPMINLAKIPGELDGWTAKGLPIDKQFLGTVRFSKWVHRNYTRGQDEVNVMLASDLRLDPTTNLMSLKTAIPGAGWHELETASIELDAAGSDAQSYIVGSGSRRKLVYRWHLGLESPAAEIVRSLLYLDRGPLRRPGRAVVVRLSTDIEPGPGGRRAATERLDQFAATYSPFLRDLLSESEANADNAT